MSILPIFFAAAAATAPAAAAPGGATIATADLGDGAAAPYPRHLLAFGFGAGGLTERSGGKTSASQGVAVSAQLGWRLRESLYLQLDMNATSLARVPSHPTRGAQQAVVAVGPKWFLSPGLYVRGGVGVGHAIYQRYDALFDTEHGAWGPGATVGLGLLAPTLPTRRFALGVELTESAVLYDGRRLHHNFGVALVTQFALERPRP